jgi:hypothetical protein
MRAFIFFLAFSSITSIAQNLVLVNSGVSSGSITNNSSSNQLIVGSIGSPTSINLLRIDLQVVHHGMEHPILMKSKKSLISFSVFPNPTIGPVTLKISGDLKTQPENIMVLDATGKLVVNQTFSESINLGNLAPGTYLIQISTKGSIFQSNPIVLIK